MSDVDEQLNEIRERHRKDARWHCGPSMICPQSHDDRAFLLNEITRLREQLHLANIDAVGAHAEANDLRDHLSRAVALIIRLIDTRRCSVSDLRTLNAARAALKEAKP